MKKKTTLAQHCSTCMYFVFDESVGEHKCTARHHYVHEPDIEAVGCDEYNCEEAIEENTENEEAR